MLKNKGFTLVELTITIALLAIVGVILARLMFFAASQNNRVKYEIESQNLSSMTLDYIVSEVRRHDASKSISFLDSDTVLQIEDREAPFKVEGTTYVYQWMWSENEEFEGKIVNRLHVKFGNTTSEQNSGGSDIFLISQDTYLQSIRWHNIERITLDGDEIVKVFDIEIIRYDTGGQTKTTNTSVYIRSNL